ncbi:ABC-three component system protein [Spartinivicinus poritis]|uniref:ABC-three component systems C-terminal domain-containing protein n=1 Tax=Spartinivicinus poritis TaxID=2994640 RepID=A0ABT5U7R5_9GAMM|nr:ABC-three component system protein [Spartinivicinus sp. A2-2]MDE1462426.1 hypothetical protein [Spartinivicinus sp. A2-2]
MENSVFDATSSMLGYIYQVRYALLLALKKIADANDPDDCFISIEKLDDIAFEEKGNPVELLQAKYHGSPGNLTDRSPDLWKTIRVWSEMIQKESCLIEEASFTLLTTEKAAPNSIASYLGTEEKNRNVSEALKNMREISKEKSSIANKKAYVSFNLLSENEQEILLSSVYVITKSPDILTVEEKIKKQIRLSVSASHINAFTSRLEGIWFKKVIEVMQDTDQNGINIGELVDYIDDLRTQFLPGNLPADFDEHNPDEIEIEDESRVFMRQLSLIGLNSKAIRVAVINYYKAYEQRSKWSREGLVKPGEIQKYLNRLKDEWINQSVLIEMDYDLEQDDNEKIKYGRELYKECQKNSILPIRPGFKSAYVARGTYHTLSDKMAIGWHPDFSSLLSNINC